MLWVLLDVLIGLLALSALGVTGWQLYRRIRVLAREVGAASERVSRAAPPPVSHAGSPAPERAIDQDDLDDLFTNLPQLRPARRT